MINDKDYLKYLNDRSNKMSTISFFSNEIFLYFYIKIFDLELTFSNANCTINYKCFKLGGALPYLFLTLFRYTIIAKIGCFFLFLLSLASFLFYLLAVIPLTLIFSFYLLFKYVFTSKYYLSKDSKICVVRSPATFSKINTFAKNNGITLISDGITYQLEGKPSLLSLVSFIGVCQVLLKLPIRVYRDYLNLVADCRHMIGFCLIGNITKYYFLRLPISSIYYLLLEEVLKTQHIKTLYTGNKEDRFALIESYLTSTCDVELVCVPHGIEYGIKLPGGLAGTLFYTTSFNAQLYLNKLYNNEQFYYADEIANLMFKKNINGNMKDKKIVFFTEARGVSINVDIIKALIHIGVEFFIKLHPKDIKGNYSSLFSSNDVFLDDFDFAISNSICLCRKSTVLLEALYNNSKSISILVDKSDSLYVNEIFPSLSQSSILKVYNFNELELALKNLRVM